MTPSADTFAGRVALVTGAGRGMGRAFAQRLADGGATIVATDIDGAAAVETVAPYGDRGLARVTDIANRSQVAELIAEITGRFGRLDILVNNAGILYPTRLADITEEEWNRTIAVNLTGQFFVTQLAVAAMRARRYGRIVNISSSAGRSVSTLGGVHYTASKAGVLGLTRAVAKEVARDGITVNAVCPGLIATDMVHTTVSGEVIEGYARSFPIQRLGTSMEVADLVCFLASEAAGYITGASIDINGGDLMI